MRAHAAVHPQPDDRDGEAAPEARGTDAAEPAPPVQPTPATKLHAPPRGIQRTVSNASEGSEGSRLRALDSVAAVFDLLGGRNLVSDMMTADAACALESESTSVASKDRMPKRRFVDANSARLPVSAKYVLNPNNAFMRWWDLVMFGLLVFTALATPYEVGFLRTQLDGMFWLNRFVDVLFLVDIGVNFFLPYFDADVGMFVVNHSKIAKRYMCTWFFVDIISIMPFDTLALLLDAPVFHTLKIVRLVRLLRLFKLIRMFRASRMFRRWEAYMSISHAWNTILQFFCLSVIVAHWLACAWGAVVEVEEHVDARGVTNNWRVAYGVDGASHARQYLASLYWSVMTITTIGYGDVAPVTDGERLLSIFGMVVGCSVYAYTIGAVAGVVERMDKPSTEFYQHLDDLNSFMSENNLPAELRRRLRSYFTYCRQQHRQRHYRHLFNQMTPALRGEVSLYTNSMWVEQVPFFKKASRSEWRGFVTAVTMALEYEVFAPQEMVFRVGELANKMYIVQRGLGANQGRILSTGHYFGEDMLLQSARRTYSVRALTYLDVASLSKQNLTELLERNNFPNTYRQIRRHVLKLAFRRAFVRFARCMASLKASARHDSARMDILRGGAAAAPRSRTEPSSPLRARSGKSRDDSKQEERVRDTCRPASGTHTVRFSLPPLAPLAPPAPPAASESPAPMDVPTAAGSEVPPVVADSPGSAAPARHQLWSANSARASTQPSRLGRKETTAAELSRMQFLMERGFSDMGDRLNVVLQLRSEVDVLRHEIAKLRQEQQHRSRVHQLHLVVITVIMLALVALVIAAR